MTHTYQQQLDDFHDLNFVQDEQYPNELFEQSPRFRASYTCNGLIMSVVYGGGCYGRGPECDQYELALMKETEGCDFIPLTSQDDVCGWIDAESISKVMFEMQKNPDEIHNLSLDVN